MYASQPAARVFSWSSFIAIAVSAMMGIAAVAASPFSNAVAASPSIPGNCTSIRIRSGCAVRASVRPLSASPAPTVSWPAFSRSRVASFMFAALSSMISILATGLDSDLLEAQRGERSLELRPADRLLQDGGGAPAQAEIRDFQPRGHDHRHARERAVLAQLAQEIPAVQPRKLQVDRDQAERLLARHGEPRFRAHRAQHAEALGLQQQPDQLGGFVVVLDHQRGALASRGGRPPG